MQLPLFIDAISFARTTDDATHAHPDPVDQASDCHPKSKGAAGQMASHRKK
jgi:hypothetical protein